MKVLSFILIVYTTLFAGLYNAYSEDSASSGVLVFGPSVKTTTGSATDKIEPSGEDNSKIDTPDLTSSGRILMEISGSRIGGINVSKSVNLPSEGEVMFVDIGQARAFNIFSVDGEGRETLVLNANPENAIGKKLPRGTYKAYPVDLDGKLALQKLTVSVKIGLVESKMQGASKIGEPGNVMIPGNPEEAK